MSANYLQWSVEELFQRAASHAPEPGGGGVSAMAGCLGMGMLVMVAQITYDKEKESERKEELGQLIQDSQQQIENLKNLAQQDMAAYQNFMAALGLPKDTPEEKELREKSKHQAALLAANVPLEIAKTCHAGLQGAKRLGVLGSKYAISDVGTGAYLLEGALKGALLMVEANLSYIGAPEAIKELVKQKELLFCEAEELCRATQTVVTERMR